MSEKFKEMANKATKNDRFEVIKKAKLDYISDKANDEDENKEDSTTTIKKLSAKKKGAGKTIGRFLKEKLSERIEKEEKKDDSSTTTKKTSAKKLDLPEAPTEALTSQAKQYLYKDVEDYYFKVFSDSGANDEAEFQEQSITADNKDELNKYFKKLGLSKEIKTTKTKWKTIYKELLMGQENLTLVQRLERLYADDEISEEKDKKPRVIKETIGKQGAGTQLKAIGGGEHK